ncbi:phage holin family protein [Rhizobium sp. ARZ01]|uniref:phage holin family protein n=1 Tax=Rhizobium sp. ARZ01 TaxID=2769313 RepID=UPI001780B34F|nr:phage holin family protein [Rhizobium sp. ARZ01]MBD9372767.1 phage holin family protein [Rhizobium sp. ARZ01]
MSDKYNSLVGLLDAWFGGAFTTLIGAFIGRIMWHAQEVKKARRKFLGRELIWELPIAVGMALIGEGLASWLQFGQPVSTGLVAALAYLGPRGAEVLFMKWFGAKVG